MTTPTTLLVNDLKAAGQDFEWYPTTDEMLQAVAHCCGDIGSLLDIGAGDGRALLKIQQYRQRDASQARDYGNKNTIDHLYAIEKSEIHIQNMPAGISIVGTDFLLQSLIDKDVDGIFCNPPYSEYEEWAVKVISEAYAKYIFLILPSRWKDSKLIQAALKARKTSARSIWAGSFLEADRKARGTVEILQISLRDTNYSRYGKEDPFGVWFESVFPEFDKIKPDAHADEDTPKQTQAQKLHSMVAGANLVDRLAELYRAEMASLFKNYRALCGLDPELLCELGVKHEEVKNGLKQKIAGTKNKYWAELFDHLDKITDRLTKQSRDKLLEKMRSCGTMDYSESNAYAVVLWVIKNANAYINEQVTTLFKELSEPENIKNYKSNQKTWDAGRWRYNSREEWPHTHYTLDYRIVIQKHEAIQKDSYRSYDFPGGLSKKCHEALQDIMTVANNLGFSSTYGTDSENMAWGSGMERVFYMAGVKQKPLMAVRAYLNGNMHLKLDQEFIKTLNIEASRLLGWIKTPHQAAEETGYSEEFCQKRFNSNRVFVEVDSRKMLTA